MSYTGYERQKKIRQRRRFMSYLYLSQHPCVDCGEQDPRVLEYDHVRGEKEFNISAELSATRISFDRLVQEIEKCDVRCGNCHKRRHAIERGWYDFPEDLFEDPPRKSRKRLDIEWHGTHNGYANFDCRCSDCKDAHAAYMRKQRRSQGQTVTTPS